MNSEKGRSEVIRADEEKTTEGPKTPEEVPDVLKKEAPSLSSDEGTGEKPPPRKSTFSLVPWEELEKIRNPKAVDVKSENPKSIFEMAKHLTQCALDHRGVGIAAPQVGVARKIMVWADEEGNFNISINPRYLSVGSRIQTVEGCLSIPGKNFQVRRYKAIRAQYWSVNLEDGARFVWVDQKLRRDEAIRFQHETDHCEGVTIAQIGKEV